MSLRPANPPEGRDAGTPSSEVTGPVCRVPSPALGPTGLGLLSQRTSVGSRYDHRESFPSPFSWAPGISRRAQKGSPSHLQPLLTFTVLHGLQCLGGSLLAPSLPSPRRQERGLRCRTYPGGAGILTGFPFGTVQLGGALGSAYRRLTKHCRRTLALSAAGILTPLCCYYRRDPRRTPVHRSSRPDFCPVCAPTYLAHPSGCATGVSAPGFSPDSFSGPPSSAGELLRTL